MVRAEIKAKIHSSTRRSRHPNTRYQLCLKKNKTHPLHQTIPMDRSPLGREVAASLGRKANGRKSFQWKLRSHMMRGVHLFLPHSAERKEQGSGGWEERAAPLKSPLLQTSHREVYYLSKAWTGVPSACSGVWETPPPDLSDQSFLAPSLSGLQLRTECQIFLCL